MRRRTEVGAIAGILGDMPAAGAARGYLTTRSGVHECEHRPASGPELRPSPCSRLQIHTSARTDRKYIAANREPHRQLREDDLPYSPIDCLSGEKRYEKCSIDRVADCGRTGHGSGYRIVRERRRTGILWPDQSRRHATTVSTGLCAAHSDSPGSWIQGSADLSPCATWIRVTLVKALR